MIAKGSHVKCLMQNSAAIEGIVEEWNDNYVKLKSLEESSFLIITHPKEDIRLIKILIKNQTPIDKKIEEAQASPSADPMRLKTLAQLKTMKIEQDKAIIANKLKSHTIGEVKMPTYSNPFIKK